MSSPRFRLGPTDALIVVDVQKDFCPGGALAVPGGDEIVPTVNALIARFATVVLTQDWHPDGHSSFASSHPGKAPFEGVDMPYGPQVLWPDHCRQNSTGAEWHDALQAGKGTVFRKGSNPQIDSYSGFLENDRRTETGLADWLAAKGIRRIFVTGLAFDFCVGFTALDGRAKGLEVVVLEDATRGIDINGSMAAMRARLLEAGVQLAQSEAVLGSPRTPEPRTAIAPPAPV